MLKLIGAGLGRTGTLSLRVALEKLLAAPCYHMSAVFEHPEHVPFWRDAARGAMPDWNGLLRGYAAAVDWPAASFWQEISAAFPAAVILLSERDSADAWWRSASETIFPASRKAPAGEWRDMAEALFAHRFGADLDDRAACIAAYERHNATVRRTAPASRLVTWKPGDGWAPLCAALRVAIPDEPFPHVNSKEEFLARHG
jgi:hypothetical protein